MRAHYATPLNVTCLAVAQLVSSSTAATAIALDIEPKCAECDRVIGRVLKLLPRKPERVVVIDASRSSPALQRGIDHAEGFVTTGVNTVYLKKQGSTFQHALRGPDIWDYVLAIIIWHEMAHIEGASEPEAQREEELLWQQFILERRVDSRRGLAYLELLRKRR